MLLELWAFEDILDKSALQWRTTKKKPDNAEENDSLIIEGRWNADMGHLGRFVILTVILQIRSEADI